MTEGIERETYENPFEDVIETAIENAEDGKVTIGALMRALGDRSYGPLILALGLFAATPLAALPGAAGVAGLIIFALALQMALGKAHPWLPGRVLRIAIEEKNLRETYEKSHAWLSRIDHIIKPRWSLMASGFARRTASSCLILLSLLMIPLEFIPFVVGVPATAAALFGAAITARDGLLMTLGFVMTGGSAYLFARLFF